MINIRKRKNVASTSTINKKEHNWGGWVTDEEAVCIYTGTKHRNCTNCTTHIDYVTIPAPRSSHEAAWEDFITWRTNLPTTMRSSMNTNWGGKNSRDKARDAAKKEFEDQIKDLGGSVGSWSGRSPNNNDGNQYENDPNDRYWEWTAHINISGYTLRGNAKVRVHWSKGTNWYWIGKTSGSDMQYRYCKHCLEKY